MLLFSNTRADYAITHTYYITHRQMWIEQAPISGSRALMVPGTLSTSQQAPISTISSRMVDGIGPLN